MGCDGGTIPKRNEIVKNKQKDQGRDKNADLAAKWQFCALSGLRLKKPIVSCQLGRLYNKDAIIEYLLELKSNLPSSSTGQSSLAAHIKSLKDVKELKLKEKPEFDVSHQASSGSEQFRAQFVCPISGLDINGKYKFYYLLTCGCVVSERALKEVPNGELCILCSGPYNPDKDVIVLNGDEDEVKDLKERLISRRRKQREAKQRASDFLGSASSSKIGISPTEARAGQTSKSGKDCDVVNNPNKKHKPELALVR